MFDNGLSRRTFLKSTLAVGGILTGSTFLAGCIKNPDDHLIPPEEVERQKNLPIDEDWLGKPPEIPENKISNTQEADVVIIGAGLAGITAARVAAENGASVLVVEKAATWQWRSGQYGTIGNKFQKQLGITFDKNAAINENMKQMGYRADQRAWNYWADHSGEDFDWMIELAPAINLMQETDINVQRDKINLQLSHYPTPPEYNREEENSPSYPTVMTFLPSQKPMLELVMKKCLELGVKFIYSTRAIKLLRPRQEDKGRVEGVICQDIKGNYHRYNARRAIILTTGDYGNNKSMIKHFVPWAQDYFNVYPNRDALDNPVNVGDGHKMGVWIGAKMEDGPHAPMIHTLGGPLGTDAFLLVNSRGVRFMNEDTSGQQLSCGLYRQPGNFGWQIFDDKWSEQLQYMGVSHGSVNHCVENNPHLPEDCQWTVGRTSYTSREDLLKTPGLIIANSLEDLAIKLFPEDKKSQQIFFATINRYNELADAHNDLDFGKAAKRLFPVKTAPFYAGKMEGGAMLINFGGLTVNPLTANVLDEDNAPILGLYAAGNTQGGRFVGDYPVVTAGVSHAFALVYGRLAGTQAAKCDPNKVERE